jgi:Zn-dependent metalloprotease
MKNLKFTIIFCLVYSFLFSQDGAGRYNLNSCSQFNGQIKTAPEQNFINKYRTSNFNNEIYNFNGISINELGGINNLFTSLDNNVNSNFQLNYIRKARSSNKTILEFQHYYKEIKVDGSGFDLLVENEDTNFIPGPCSNCPPPIEPCDLVYLLSPHVYNAIDLDVNVNLSAAEISSILNINTNEIFHSEKVIRLFHNFDCEYKLLYEVSYKKNGNKISWIDINSQKILSTFDQGVLLNAPVEQYGDINGLVNLNDSNINGTTHLISNGGQVITYNFNNADFTETFDNVSVADYSIDKIPTTTSNEWSESDASKSTFQAHHVGVLCRNAFEQYLGYNFNRLHIGANLVNGTAGVPLNFSSNFDDTYILVASDRDNGNSMAVFDVVAHELGHVVLYELGLKYTTNENKLLHEGISDMIGVYIASKIKGITNWHTGQDVPYSSGRNLQNPVFSQCFSTHFEFSGSGNRQHSWAVVLGHLYYLLSEGSSGIDKIGMDKSLSIILDAVSMLGAEPSLQDFIEMTVAIADQELGVCPGGVAFRKAWDKIICETSNISDKDHPFRKISELITSYKNYNCNITITGNNTYFCEENNFAYLCSSNGIPGSTYNWTILGNYGSNFGIGDNSYNSNYYEGQCLHINKFPDFPYYPQTITIELYVSGVGVTKHKIKIIDCDGDDPTCNEYYNSFRINNISNIDDHKDTEFSIYPNPTSGVLTIHVEPSILEDLEYQILSFDGLVLFSNKLKINSDSNNRIVLNEFTEIPPNIYLIKLKSSGYSKIFKIVKQ